MPVFWAQMYCRTWWSIYVLDRRLAIESGRPYLIQDCNIDTALPLELGDDWLSQYSKATDTAQSLKRETSAEIASEPITPIPYLTAMVRFSRVVGKVWELMYGIKGLNPTSSAMVEYADSVLCNLLENVPKDLSFDPRISPDLQFGTRLRWQVKQTMLLFSVRLSSGHSSSSNWLTQYVVQYLPSTFNPKTLLNQRAARWPHPRRRTRIRVTLRESRS